MPGTNGFYPNSTGVGATVLDDADYAADPRLSLGASVGELEPAYYNKGLRQSTVISSLIGQFIVSLAGVDANDSQNIATLLANFRAALNAQIASYVGSNPTNPTNSNVYLGSATTGSAAALTTALAPTPNAAYAGMLFTAPITNTNASGATIDFGFGPKPIVLNRTGAPLPAGALPGAVGYLGLFEYDGANARILNPSDAFSGTFSVISDQTFDGTIASSILTIPTTTRWIRIKVLLPGSSTTGQSVALRTSLDGSSFLTTYTYVCQGTASATSGTTTSAMGIACTVDNNTASEGFDETLFFAGSSTQYSHTFTRYFGINASSGSGSSVDLGGSWCRTQTIGLAQKIQFVGAGYYGNANGNNIPAGTRIIVEALN